MTVSGQINFGTAGLSDLTVLTYTDSGLGTPTANSLSFADASDGLYNEAGTAGDTTGWQVVSSATAGYSRSGPIGTLAAGGGGGSGAFGRGLAVGMSIGDQ